MIMDSIQGSNLLWINGKFVDKTVAFKNRKVINISKYLKPNSDNCFITRNANNLQNGGGINSIWITKAKNGKKIFHNVNIKKKMTLNHMPPAYHDSLIIYETFIRSISPNGTFDGMYYKIPYLKQLGINMVWLMPIHPIGKINRKGSLGSPYSVRNYFGTNNNYGTKKQFNIMNKRMKQNNIKLIIDAVINHTAWDNSLIYKHPKYYTKNSNNKIISPLTTNWTDVADLNYDNVELSEYMLSYFDYWLNDMQIDGFRCDVSEMVPMDFWNELRENFKANSIKPFMLAEGTKTDNLTSGFDAVYGWDLYYAFQNIHSNPTKTNEIYEVLNTEFNIYPEESEVMHFAENHDTPRAAKSLGNNDHNLALFFIFTAPGIPMIYCGEELGNTQKLNLFEKTTINWRVKNRKTYNLVKDLTSLRISSKELIKGNINKINDVDFIAGFSRTYNNSTWNIIGNYDSVPHLYECSPNSIIYSDDETKIIENGILLSAKGYCIFK